MVVDASAAMSQEKRCPALVNIVVPSVGWSPHGKQALQSISGDTPAGRVDEEWMKI